MDILDKIQLVVFLIYRKITVFYKILTFFGSPLFLFVLKSGLWWWGVCEDGNNNVYTLLYKKISFPTSIKLI